jgi:hypothetical protein
VGTGIAVTQGRVLFPPYLVQAVQDLIRGFGFYSVLLIARLSVTKGIEAINDKGALHLSSSFLSAVM